MNNKSKSRHDKLRLCTFTIRHEHFYIDGKRIGQECRKILSNNLSIIQVSPLDAVWGDKISSTVTRRRY